MSKRQATDPVSHLAISYGKFHNPTYWGIGTNPLAKVDGYGVNYHRLSLSNSVSSSIPKDH